MRPSAFVAEYAALREEAKRSGGKIFFADEAHFRADAELRGKWVLRGEPALVNSSSPRYGEKASYYSAVCLETGEVEWMELEGNSNAGTSSAFLRQLAERHAGHTLATASLGGPVFELKFSSPLSPPPFLVSEVQKWWADEVARRSGGRIVWTDFYWSGALTKAGETLEAVQVGLADVGMIAWPYYPGKLPLANWTYSVPFGPGDPLLILEAAQQLYYEVPALRQEVEDYNLVFLFPSAIDTYNLTSKDPIVTYEDFDGIKIASIGSYHPKILEVAGATAIAMPVAEHYQALQSGIIDAEFLPWDISHAYKYHDFNKNITWVDMGAIMPVGLGINKDTWDTLPSNLQGLMLEVADEAVQLNASLILERRNAALAEWEKLGVTRHDMLEEDRTQWANALDDIPGSWIKEMEDNGLPGRNVMVKYLETLEALGHMFPRRWAVDYR